MTAYLKSSSVSLPSSSFLDKVAIHLTQIITDTLSDGDDDEHSSSEREMEMETGPSMVSPTPTSGPWPPSVLLKILNHLNARGVSRKPFEIHTKRLVLRAARMDDVDCFHEIMKDRETMRYWSTKPHADIKVTEEWVKSMVYGWFNGIFDFVVVLREDDDKRPEHLEFEDRQKQDSERSSDPINVNEALSSLSPFQPPSNLAFASRGGKAIGKLGCYFSNEIGFILNKNYWSQGYASEAFEAWMRLFKTLIQHTPRHLLIPKSEVLFGTFDHDLEDGMNQDNGSGGTNRIWKRSGSSERRSETRGLMVELNADADPRNEPSLRLLKRFGFREVGKGEGTYEVEDGWADSVYLQLDIPIPV